MKVVIPGGTGQLGRLLAGALAEGGHEVVIVSRRADLRLPGARIVAWDGRSAGAWMAELDGADVVVNLAGRSVSCRYTEANLNEMMASRADSATIYAHSFDRANDEASGIIGRRRGGGAGAGADPVDSPSWRGPGRRPRPRRSSPVGHRRVRTS